MNQHHSAFQFIQNSEKSFSINILPFKSVEIVESQENQTLFKFSKQPNFFSLLEAIFEENGNIIKLLSQGVIPTNSLLEFSTLVYYHLQAQSSFVNWHKLPNRTLSDETLSKLRTIPFAQLDPKSAFEVAHCYLGQIDVFSVLLDWTQFGTSNRITQAMQRSGKHMSEHFIFGGRSFFDFTQEVVNEFLLHENITSSAFLLSSDYATSEMTIGYLDLMQQYVTAHFSQSDELNTTVIDVFDSTYWLSFNFLLIQLKRIPMYAEMKEFFSKVDFALLIGQWRECQSIIQRYELIKKLVF